MIDFWVMVIFVSAMALLGLGMIIYGIRGYCGHSRAEDNLDWTDYRSKYDAKYTLGMGLVLFLYPCFLLIFFAPGRYDMEKEKYDIERAYPNHEIIRKLESGEYLLIDENENTRKVTPPTKGE